MASAAASPALDPTAPDPNRWKALSVLALVSFMLVLDITVVNVALPNIQHDLKMSQPSLAWIVDGYTLTCGGLLLLGGRLGDLLGRRRMFFVGVTIFAVASALSGAANTSGLLIAARFLQGAGEAFASPAAIGLVALLFTDPVERSKALGIFGGVAGLGGTLGPIISGGLISIASWRWIFFVNLPIAAIAIFAVGRLVKESKAERHPDDTSRPDVGGALIATAGLVGIVYGLIEAANHPWGSGRVLASLLGGVALLVVFAIVEAKISNPLIPLRFFANRTRVTANLVTLFFSTVFFTQFFLLTLYFQEVHHYSPIRTGVYYLPFGIAIGAAIGLSAVLLPKLGIKAMLTAGFLLYALGVGWLAGLHVDSSYLVRQLPALVLMALGSGFMFSGFQNAALHEVSEQDAGLASGVQNMFQQVGGAVGLAVLATLALRHAAGQVKHGVNPAVAYVHGDSLALYIGCVIMVLGAVMVTIFFEHVEIASPEIAAAGAH